MLFYTDLDKSNGSSCAAAFPDTFHMILRGGQRGAQSLTKSVGPPVLYSNSYEPTPRQLTGRYKLAINTSLPIFTQLYQIKKTGSVYSTATVPSGEQRCANDLQKPTTRFVPYIRFNGTTSSHTLDLYIMRQVGVQMEYKLVSRGAIHCTVYNLKPWYLQRAAIPTGSSLGSCSGPSVKPPHRAATSVGTCRACAELVPCVR